MSIPCRLLLTAQQLTPHLNGLRLPVKLGSKEVSLYTRHSDSVKLTLLRRGLLQRLACLLLLERSKGEASPHSAYIQTLPARLTLLASFTPDEARELQASYWVPVCLLLGTRLSCLPCRYFMHETRQQMLPRSLRPAGRLCKQSLVI